MAGPRDGAPTPDNPPVPGAPLPEELGELVAAASRLAERALGPQARETERAGRWSGDVLTVLRDLALGGLDLPEQLGGAGAGTRAKVAVLEALAHGDPGGLPAADQPGAAAGALLACPDTSLATEIAAACLAGEEQCPLVVLDEHGAGALEWAPGWPPLRRAWVLVGDSLRLAPVPAAEEVTALAFQASGGVTAPLDASPPIGRWDLGSDGGLAVRGRARLWAAAVALGVARAAFSATVAYTTERVVFGKPVAHHQGNAFELAAAAANLHGAGLAVSDAAARFDSGDPDAGFWATQAWIETMDAAAGITDLGIQLLGGHGFLMDHVAEKRFREARMLALLYGGRDAADADAAAAVLRVPDPVFALGTPV